MRIYLSVREKAWPNPDGLYNVEISRPTCTRHYTHVSQKRMDMIAQTITPFECLFVSGSLVADGYNDKDSAR
jgi:hypothetical protein